LTKAPVFINQGKRFGIDMHFLIIFTDPDKGTKSFPSVFTFLS